jgi:tetratricopeptide (TPR) repeat protein
MRKASFKCVFPGWLLLLLLLNQPAGLAGDQASSRESVLRLGRQAATCFQNGDLQEAVNLVSMAVASNPQDWLSHAALSYYTFQQGEIIKSVEEGEKAVALAPDDCVALSNLALIKEGLDDCAGALPLYERARKLAAGDPVPWLGLARCQIKTGHEDRSMAVLKEMAAAGAGSFDWFFELADTYLRMNKADLAVPVAARAMELAANPSQKTAGSTLSLVALIQDGQLERAAVLKGEVFKNCHPADYQLYVRVASALLPASDPAAGKELLEAALADLKGEEAAEGFFRLGRVFAEKVVELKNDESKAFVWLNSAESACRRSISLDPEKTWQRAKYYLGLAGVLGQEGKLAEMSACLETARKLDPSNTLPQFLMERLSQDRQSEHAGSAGQSSSLSRKPLALKLEKVRFVVDNINCACHISKIVEAMSQVRGVAFVFVDSRQKPYQGVMLVEQDRTSVNQVFGETLKKMRLIYETMNPPFTAEFIAASSSPLNSASEAVRIALNAVLGSPTSFYTAFKAVVPFDPIRATGEKSATVKANDAPASPLSRRQ